MDAIEDRVKFYTNLKQLAEKTHLITDADCVYLTGENPSKSLTRFFSRTFDASSLLIAYGEYFYYRTFVVRFSVWGKFTQDESLFIIGVSPHYAKSFCEEILPTLRTDCPTVSLAVYSQLRDKLQEIYSNF